MNKANVAVLIVALALIVTTVAVGAAGYEPGSAEDPVVTKSYVDSQIAAALKGVGTGGSSATFKPVFVEAGKNSSGRRNGAHPAQRKRSCRCFGTGRAFRCNGGQGSEGRLCSHEKPSALDPESRR